MTTIRLLNDGFIKISFIIKYLVAALFLLFFSLIKEASLFFTITLLFWLFLVMFSLENIGRHISLFFFLVSFFVFLIGREFCFTFFNIDINYSGYVYLTTFNDFAFFCLFISLFFISVGYCFSLRENKENKRRNAASANDKYTWKLRSFLKKYYYFCYVFLLLALYIKVSLVFTIGYVETYIITERSSSIVSIINYIGAFCPIVFCLYLGTKPTKTDAFFPILSYEIYGLLTLLSGIRFTFVGVSMLILIYLVNRNREENGWFPKWLKKIVLLSIPFLLIFLGCYDVIRLGDEYRFSSITDPLIRFFEGQGGSINMIKRVKYYESSLVDLSFCSLSNLHSILFENLIIRNITGNMILEGNSVEHALLGHSLAHRLSLYEYGNAYLTGHGVGSCYIAELYHDFGYIGICVGSFFYGLIIRLVGDNKDDVFLINGLSLAVMYNLLYAPRGNFDGFLNGVFGLYALLGYAFIYCGCFFISKGLKK